MLKTVYAIVGEDLFLQLEAIRSLLRDAPTDIQLIDVDGQTAQVGDVFDELVSFAMFASAKLVVVRDADEFISKFRESLEAQIERANVPPGSALVLRCKSLPKNQRIYKLISKVGQVLECNPPKDLPRWILDRAKHTHQLALGTAEANLLADLIGADLGRIDNELAKLALQCDGKADSASILKSVSFQREQEMWDMTDEVAAGNTKAALLRWRHMLQSDPSAEYRAVTWLTIWLEKARKAWNLRKEGKSDSAIAYDVKIFPREKQSAFFKNLNALGEGGVRRMINLLAELDFRSKRGLGEMSHNVEKFILASGRR
jgi:DNA polymerase-3 subunit delta